MVVGDSVHIMLLNVQNHPLIWVLITLLYRWEKGPHSQLMNPYTGFGPSIFCSNCLPAWHCISRSVSFTFFLPWEPYLTSLNHTETVSFSCLPPRFCWNRWPSPSKSKLSWYWHNFSSCNLSPAITLCTEIVIHCELSTPISYYCLKIMFLHQSHRGSTPFIKIRSYWPQASVWKYPIHTPPQGNKVDRKSVIITVTARCWSHFFWNYK